MPTTIVWTQRGEAYESDDSAADIRTALETDTWYELPDGNVLRSSSVMRVQEQPE